MRSLRNPRTVFAAGAMLAALLPGPVSAQTTMDRSAEVAPPTFIEVVDVRSPDAIKQALSAARELERAGEQESRAARSAFERAEGEVRIAKSDVDAIKARLDLAKKEKRESDQARLEADKKQMELHVRILERRRNLYEAERRLGEAQRDYARALILELTAEERLAENHGRLTEMGFNPAHEPDHINLERRLLELQKTRIQRSENMASREGTAVERRISVLEAQAEWLVGAR